MAKRTQATRAESADREAYIKRGQDAWQRHKSDATWTDWLAIGEALDIGRSDAMSAAGTNKAEGSRYNKLFGKWLKDHAFDDIDQSDRKRLFDVLEHRSEIEDWRKTLPLTTRLRTNHPSTVWRKWSAANKPKAPGNHSAAAQRAAQAKQNERDLKDARAHIAELEAGRATAPEIDDDAALEELLDQIRDQPEGEWPNWIANTAELAKHLAARVKHFHTLVETHMDAILIDMVKQAGDKGLTRPELALKLYPWLTPEQAAEFFTDAPAAEKKAKVTKKAKKEVVS